MGSNETETGEWQRYFDDLLNPALKVDRISYVAPLISVPCMDKPFEMSELDYVIKKAKCGKAPGLDRVPYEFFKNCPLNFLEKLLGTFNNIYETANVPLSFGNSIIFPLFKKGDRNIVGNYRGVVFSDSIARAVATKRPTYISSKLIQILRRHIYFQTIPK